MREPDAWIDLVDFSPGIVHDLGHQVVGTPVGRAFGQDGAASIENTYRCVALAGGGLGPLPQQDWTYSRPSLGGDAGSPVTLRTTFLVDGPLGGNVIPGETGMGAELWDPRNTSVQHPVQFYVFYEAAGTNGGVGRIALWAQERVYNVGPTMTAGNVTAITNDSVSSGASAVNNFSPGLMAIHYLTHTSTSKPVILRNYISVDGATGAGLIASPDPASGTTTSTLPFGSPFNASTMGPLVSHQGRAVLFGEAFFGSGFKGPNDFYFFTVPTIPGVNANSQIQDTTGGTAASVVTQDSLSGVGVAASISASDLLIITHTKGAALVQGDLANPTVRRMPGVQSTNGAQIVGVQTPVGYVYGVNRGGIYAWTGDSSTFLSHQLPDDCWIVSNGSGIINNMGRFELWNNWVMCPNNWLYDILSNSWWRIDDPSVFAAYEWWVNPVNGYVYGNAPQWTDPGSGNMVGYIRGYNRRFGATSWSWQSQPLSRTRNRVVEVREVDVDCVGAGTIQVTLIARDGTTQSQTYTLAGSGTLSQFGRLSFSVQGVDVKVRIVATGTGGTNPAPVVHALHIGYNERMHLGAG